MTNQPAPTGVSPHQVFSQAMSGLFMDDPDEAKDALKQIGEWASGFANDVYETSIKARGYRRGTDEEFLREVSVNKPETVWRMQKEHFPPYFHRAAMRAYRLSAPLPPWVEVYALTHGAEPRDGKPALRALVGGPAPLPMLPAPKQSALVTPGAGYQGITQEIGAYKSAMGAEG